MRHPKARPARYAASLWIYAVLALLIPRGSAAAGAAAVRLLAADARGVTLQVRTDGWALGAPGADGHVAVTGLSSAYVLGEPGRAKLPAFSAVIALPPDARPSAVELAGAAETARDGVKLVIAGKPVFRPGLGAEQQTPGMDAVPAVADGAWPPSRVRLGSVSSMRGRKFVSLEMRPFRYDEGAARLYAASTVTVRIDFNRPASAAALPVTGGSDAHFDDVFASTVLNFEQARTWRVAPAGASAAGRASTSLFAKPATGALRNAGFDESDVEVRVKLDSTGLYQLPFDQLAAKGYPAGVPIAQVSVHRHEFVENQLVPYITLELPVEIEDANNNGIFDTGDWIWMYAQDWAERSAASQYQRWWGDAEVVFVTRKSAGGRRVPVRAGWRGTTGLSSLLSYPYTEHFEKNFAAQLELVGQPGDTAIDLYHWNEIQFYYLRPDTLRFEVRDIDTSRTAVMNVQWVGRTFNSHYAWAAVRNGRNQVSSIVDSVYWSSKYPQTAAGSLRGSAFTEGATNFLREWGKTSGGAPDPTTNSVCNAGLNWFDLTYWRRYRAVHDRIAFNTGDGAGEVQMSVGGFLADSVRLYDVSDPENPVRVLLDAAHRTPAADNTLQVTFQDSTVAGSPRQYVAGVSQDPASFDASLTAIVPPPDHFGVVNRRQFEARTSGDYLVVTPEAFVPALQPLVDLRSSQGLRVIVAPTEAIYDEFNGGRHSAAAIQRFVRYAYTNWDARFLLLAGEGTLDPLNHRVTSAADFVPVLPTPGPVSVGDGFEIIPADNRYGCLTGNCDPIFGFGDVVPEMFIGRLPVNSPAEAQTVVTKIVAYENYAGDQSWRRRLLLSSDDAFSGESFFGGGSAGGSQYCHKGYEELFAGLTRKIESLVLRDAGLVEANVDTFFLRNYETNEPFDPVGAGADTCRPDRDATRARVHAGVTPILFSKLNAGVLWWNYQGHANEYVLAHEDLYVNSPGIDDKALYANAGKPFLFSAFSCHANMFARSEKHFSSFGPCLGEEMLTVPGGGAIASWASVCYEVVPRDDSSHINVEMARSLFVDPPRDEMLGDRGSRVVLGEALVRSLLAYLPSVASYSFERGIGLSYTLLGDPAQRMSIGAPQGAVAANGTPVADGQPVRLHALSDTLQLVANVISTVRLDSLGLYEESSAGVVPIPAASFALTPPFPDTANGGAYGGRYFRLTYRAPLRAQSYRYHLRSTDRYGLQRDFAVVFQLDAQLRAEGTPINDGDNVSPTANLSILILSPKPLNPLSDIALTINGASQAFTATAAPGDGSGREWIVSWTHAEYPKGQYVASVSVLGGAPILRRFVVSTASGELKLSNLYAFPNPFDAECTNFSFDLLGSAPADVRVTVYTISGHPIYSSTVRALAPGYHQLPWDGRDNEGSQLANGVYFYRLSAAAGNGAKVQQLGRLVRLRKPRHVADTALGQ